VRLGPPDPGLRVAVAHGCVLGESPFWHPLEQRLYYCDIAGRQLLCFDPRDGRLQRWDLDSEPGAIAPVADGRLLVAQRSGIGCFDPASGRVEPIAAAPYDPRAQRFNDGKCDAQGRFWVGTIVEPREPALGTLQRLSGGALQQQLDGVSVSNGLEWSPDGRTMYWADSHAGTVQAFDFDPEGGTLSRRREFARFARRGAGAERDDYMGVPDGAAMDCAGCYWVAMYDGQRVLRISPHGQILRQVYLPVRCPTMPAFGGHDLRTLYITSAREHRPEAELAAPPLAGCVLALDVDVPGLPVNFALL
jgi:sugar lactone lactonase YvrE